MPSLSTAVDWMPDHQLHVPMTLAHADACIQGVGEVLHDYLLPPGPLTFESVADGELCHVVVKRIAPLPAAVPRMAADALVNLRAALEHAIYAEVEHLLERALTADESRRIELPATTTPEEFDTWLKGRKRPMLPPLAKGSELVERIRALQPFHRKDPDEHPLRVLAEHTNHAKHRTPAVAAVRLGRVHTWPLGDPEIIVHESGAALEAGTVLATGPLYKQVPLDIWPAVAIQRPHTGGWRVLMAELAYLEEWARGVAIPILISGEKQAAKLPPRIDITKGWDSSRDAIALGGSKSAAERSLDRIQAHHARTGLSETLDLHPGRIEREALDAWVASLSDDEVLARMDELASGMAKGPWGTVEAVKAMILEAASFNKT